MNIACSSQLITDSTVHTFFVSSERAHEVRHTLENARDEMHAAVASGEIHLSPSDIVPWSRLAAAAPLSTPPGRITPAQRWNQLSQAIRNSNGPWGGRRVSTVKSSQHGSRSHGVGGRPSSAGVARPSNVSGWPSRNSAAGLRRPTSATTSRRGYQGRGGAAVRWADERGGRLRRSWRRLRERFRRGGGMADLRKSIINRRRTLTGGFYALVINGQSLVRTVHIIKFENNKNMSSVVGVW